MRHRALLCLPAFVFAACGGTVQSAPDSGDVVVKHQDAGSMIDAASAVDANIDVDNGSPSSTYPAFQVDAPQVVSGGGPVLASPKVVPVYFGNDDAPFTSQITTFLDALPTSTYWGPGLTEYGVTGPLTVTAPIQLSESSPSPTIDDSAIQTWLSGKLTSKDPAWPQPDANTVYAIFYPAITTITLQGSTSCSGFGGYHNSVLLNGTTNVAYAVVPRCGNFGSLKGVDSVTAPASHELIEASTDPYPGSTSPAYAQVDSDHIAWEFVLGGGETGDMCAQFRSSFYMPSDLGFSVQRTWSNNAALAGHDPCVPSDGSPYFNSMPVLPDNVSIGGQLTSKGVQIPVGQAKTIEVDLFSDAPTSGPWTVDAVDAAAQMGGASSLQLTWDRTTGINGEKLHLTIQVTSASQYGGEAFIIHSTLGGRHNDWIGLVGN